MNWIKSIFNWVATTTKLNWYDNQQKLILLVCIPSLTITSWALLLAGVSGYLIAFLCLVLSLLCVYAVVASRQQSDYQIRTLSNLIESMIDGDYSLRGRLKTNQAFQELLLLINNLATTLSEHKIEAKESRLLLERIMEQMDAMVLATNDSGVVIMANASARQLILQGSELTDKTQLTDFEAGRNIVNKSAGIIEINNSSNLNGEHFLFKESFLSEGKPHQLYLITNAERLLMEKERNAWQSLLRVLSHEMNNSLTPIASISQVMQKKLNNHDATLNTDELLEGVNIINERAESLGNFISSYSQLSHLPQPNKIEFDIVEQLNAITGFFTDCQIAISAEGDTWLYADKVQIEQVLINLLKNAQEAMQTKPIKSIKISIVKTASIVELAIQDNGPGLSNPDNLFVPFYTTKKQGSGIGLALCRQIMFNHNGNINLTNVTPSKHKEVKSTGAIATLTFPLS